MNDMSEERKQPDAKKPYQPPRVMAIDLRPEEAVLGNCKIGSTSGPVQPTCSSIGPCRTIGS